VAALYVYLLLRRGGGSLGGRGFLLGRGGSRFRDGGVSQSDRFAHLGFDAGRNVLIVFQKLLDVFASLPDVFDFLAEPGTGLFDDVLDDSQVEQAALARDALAVHDVKLGLAEGLGGLVLDDLDLGERGAHFTQVFERQASGCLSRYKAVFSAKWAAFAGSLWK